MIAFTKKILLLTAAAGMAALCVNVGHAQAVLQGTDAFNFPEDISFIGKGDPNKRRATARVNGNIITGTDVDHRVALILEGQNVTLTEAEEQNLRLQILRNLIDETLQVQEAVALEMEIKPEEVDSAYERYAQQTRGFTVEEMNAHLRSIGSSARSIKRQIQGELAWDRLLRRNVAPFVNVSEAEVSELFERLKASRGTAEYRLGEIVLRTTPVTREAVRANAQRIVDQLREGGSFVNYARQFSEASSAAQGGDLGWLRLEQLQNPQLEAAAREMIPGQLLGPIEGAGDFSILLLIDKRQVGMADPRDAVLSLKQISIDFPPGTAPAAAEARAAAFVEAVTQMNGCGDANAKASAIGALTVDNDQIAVRALPEALQNVLLNLNIGQATPPFGDLNEGVRVLMLCGRDDPAPVQGPNMNQLMAQLENDRINKRAQRYLRDLRRDAVIEYN